MRVVNRSLRWEIEDQMKLHGYNINQLAELTGINPGNLSMALNGISRSFTIAQLDALGKLFGKVPGWLYELYTEECISEEKLSRPRLVPYLVRCAEVGRNDCIDAVVSKILDSPRNVKISSIRQQRSSFIRENINNRNAFTSLSWKTSKTAFPKCWR